MASRSRHKYTKMGCLPGDLPRWVKIAMLESDVPLQVFPWQTINERCAKTFRKDHHKRAERRFRQSAAKEIEDGR